jgi:DNA-binding transcriptional ArsR family regulator
VVKARRRNLGSILLVLTYISHCCNNREMQAFDVLGDPLRRRILELLADGERTSGSVSEVIRLEFAVTQPAVSQHLKVLRDSGFTRVRPEGARRLYAVDTAPLRDVDAWLDRFRRFWEPHLDALAMELARGANERRGQPRQPKRNSTPLDRRSRS